MNLSRQGHTNISHLNENAFILFFHVAVQSHESTVIQNQFKTTLILYFLLTQATNYNI